jgi:alpha-L-fucosidase
VGEGDLPRFGERGAALRIEDVARIHPTERQARWQSLEFYGFCHFGVNTFTDREWGTGAEDPAIFRPSELDAEQWIDAYASAGMTGVILGCKHHDGFCLWPSAFTDYSVRRSPWKGGKGDVVAEVSRACRKRGLAFGIYLSPWDRHERCYGEGQTYNTHYKNQLRELLRNYGPVFSVWLDGACGEGPSGRRQVYDWEGFYRVVREEQREAVISVCGPDVRWCGNEAGACRASEWSVVPAVLRDAEGSAAKSQKLDDGEFARRVASADEDLGSREVIAQAGELAWYPAEVDVSLRPGWFYHAAEDEKQKPLADLLAIYEGSVGGNATLLLNVPPDKRGRIHENDALRLAELGNVLRGTYGVNLMRNARASASRTMDEGHGAANVLDPAPDSYWCPGEGTERAVLDIDFGERLTFDRVVLQEHLASGQRVERFVLQAESEAGWESIFRGTVIGYKKICASAVVAARRIRLSIEESRWCPTISHVGVHRRTYP